VPGLQRILIVEDNSELRDIYKTFLKQHGYEIELAADGNQALHKAKQFKPDLVFVDIMMPWKDGYQVLRELRHNPEYGCTKCKMVILTNLGDHSKLTPQAAHDMDGYVVKAEIELPDLLDVINSFKK
jgi:two-component system, OmpR family, alkaline phosphatase synthesis response regulator PhoP